MKLHTSLALVLIQQGYALLDASAILDKYYGNDSAWYQDRIPLFESSDQDITDVYYYRWSIFRAHQRDLGANGYISTEFLNDVGWQTMPWASLNDATGFHLLEGRWCRDRRFKEDYATFMYSSNSNSRQFSESMAAAVWQGYLVDGVKEDAVKRLDDMTRVYEAWDDSYDKDKGLYHVEPIRDATEYTISSIDASGGYDGFFGGNSFRPSINSYQYANALAIAHMASLKGGQQNTVDTYTAQATALKSRVQDALWNSTFSHFIDRYKVNNTNVTYWDPIRGRELVGMVPWAHDLPDDTTTYAAAWSHILNTNELAGEHGLRTVEPSYEYYLRQYRYEGPNPECQWNGPVWPFQMTQVLSGLANFLDHYEKGKETGVINTTDYTNLLRQYALLHRNPSTGILDLEEDYHPATGLPIVGLKRSHHYFHSGFTDLVLTGLVGIRPSANDILQVNPLASPSQLAYFRADRILYHGHEIAVQWDADGSHYTNSPAGLHIEIDGQTAASSRTLTRLTVAMDRRTPPSPPPLLTRRIAKSVQLNATAAFPRGSASVGDSTQAATYPAIDGRIWFFPEQDAKNGWDTPISNASTAEPVWFEVDFGTEVRVGGAEIAFFADQGQGFGEPVGGIRIQVLSAAGLGGGVWRDVEDAVYGDVVANGVTGVEWKEVLVEKVRLVFRPKVGMRVRIVEFKVY